MGKDVLVAMQIYGIGMVVSVLIAMIIRGLTLGIRRFAKTKGN